MNYLCTLPDNCLGEIYWWLSIDDVQNLKSTCRTLRQSVSKCAIIWKQLSEDLKNDIKNNKIRGGTLPSDIQQIIDAIEPQIYQIKLMQLYLLAIDTIAFWEIISILTKQKVDVLSACRDSFKVVIRIAKDFEPWSKANEQSLSEVEWLDLNDTKLTRIPSRIETFSALKGLVLKNNRLRDLPSAIGRLKMLIWLDLENNRLEELPPEIGNLVCLKDGLFLNNNCLKALPAQIEKLTLLEDLQLANNKLRNLPDEICLLRRLKKLNLADNQLQALPKELGKLSLLESIKAEKNQLATLPSSFGGLTSLIYLDLDYNHISIIPSGISLLSNLKTLYLEGNHLKDLPEGLFQLALRSLDVKTNPLSDELRKRLSALKSTMEFCSF